MRGQRTGLGSLEAGQLAQARLQFEQRLAPFDAAFDRLEVGRRRGLVDEVTYESLRAEGNTLIERASAQANALSLLLSSRSLRSWQIVSERIVEDAMLWRVRVDQALVVNPTNLFVPGDTGPADKPAWLYYVAGAGLLGLAGLLAFNVARKARA